RPPFHVTEGDEGISNPVEQSADKQARRFRLIVVRGNLQRLPAYEKPKSRLSRLLWAKPHPRGEADLCPNVVLERRPELLEQGHCGGEWGVKCPPFWLFDAQPQVGGQKPVCVRGHRSVAEFPAEGRGFTVGCGDESHG